MQSIEKQIQEQIADAPLLLMKELLKNKIRDAGVPEEVVADAADRILEADGEPVRLDIDGPDERTIHLAITDEDIAAVMRDANLLLEKIPDIIASSLDTVTASMTKDVKKRWREESWQFDAEIDRFRRGIKQRWGESISCLELLLHLSRELGKETFSKARKTKNRRYKREVLGRLHVRACQVTDEIIALLRCGFADGAMARWRTLHEICVVILLIGRSDEDLAQRYLDHEHIEIKAALDEYSRNADALGFEQPTTEEITQAAANFAAVVSTYGQEFKSPYGWAAKHLNIAKPILSDLESAVNRRAMRSYYKMASYNVHASTRGILFQLGNLGDSSIAVAGASNAGLDEPGQHTAFTLAAINSALLPKSPTLEASASLGTIINIRNSTADLFQKAGKRLLKDERSNKKPSR